LTAPAEILAAIAEARRLVCATHSPMDGDGLGCGLALQRALAARGQEVVFATEAPVPQAYRFLPGHGGIVVLGPDDPLPQGDLLVCLDAGEADRLGRLHAERAPGTRVLNIDHHVSNPGYGDLNWVDPHAAATGELVFQLLDALGAPFDPVLAQYLLVSLVTDTGRFCYSATTPRTLEIAAELLRRGASPDDLQRHLYGAVPVAVLRLRAQAVEKIGLHAGGRVAVLVTEADYGAELGLGAEEVKDLIDVAIGIAGVVVAALVRGLPGGGAKVSLRSKDDRADVARLASSHGGGGHIRAAGFTAPGATPRATAEGLLPELEALAVAASG